MRHALVALYLALIAYILHPSRPREEPGRPAGEAPVRVEPETPGARAEQQQTGQQEPTKQEPAKPGWAPPAGALSPVPTTPVVAELGLEKLPQPTQPEPQPQPRIAALAEAVEESGATQATPQGAETGEAVERLIRQELTRLACLAGKPERAWGKKSRAAVRRFSRRAKPKHPGEPNAALLGLLRAYPANYCKLCRPGSPACSIEATGALPKRSELTPEPREPEAPSSYLPPWMREKATQAEDAPAGEAAPEAGEPQPQVQPTPRKRSRSVSRNYSAQRSQWRARRWPTINGWPAGR